MSTEPQKFEQIAYEVEDQVATITLDRPDQLNAFTARMMYGTPRPVLPEPFLAIRRSAAMAFCAGADLSGGGETFSHGGGGDPSGPQSVVRDGGGMLTLRIFESKKPVIAAINGPAVGVGVTLTLPPDHPPTFG